MGARVKLNILDENHDGYFDTGNRDPKYTTLSWNLKKNMYCIYCRLEFNIIDKNQVKSISYNDERKILFVDCKGVIEKTVYNPRRCTTMHHIDGCIKIVFKPNKYAELQNHLKRLGFQK